jgi:hypothetical protein
MGKIHMLSPIVQDVGGLVTAESRFDIDQPAVLDFFAIRRLVVDFAQRTDLARLWMRIAICILGDWEVAEPDVDALINGNLLNPFSAIQSRTSAILRRDRRRTYSFARFFQNGESSQRPSC